MAPLTVSVLLPAGQMVVLADVVSVGLGAMVADTVLLFVHPLLSVPVTVYVVLATGVAVTMAEEAVLRLAEGAQV